MSDASAKPPQGEISSRRSSQKPPPQTNMDEIIRIVGYITDRYECVHNLFSGVLFCGPLALVFRGRIIFFDWTVVMKWEDVVHVKKLDDGISIEVRAPAAARYDFEQILHAEQAWSSLVSMHNESILDIGKPMNPTPRQVARALRRSDSDPMSMRMSTIFNFDAPTGAQDSYLEVRKSQRMSYARSVSQPNGASGVDSTEDDETQKKESEEEEETVDFEKRWSDAVDSRKAYDVQAVTALQLPCTLDSFFDMFLSDDAKYSIPNYMRANGDEDMKCSKWEESKDDASMSRTLEYTHPVNAPMAPPMAKARKEQRYYKHGDHGMVLETETYVADVPMTDCFYVSDIIQVEPIGEDKVEINMYFDIRFVKSTMFKTIIAKTTRGEFEKFMQKLSSYMAENLGTHAASVPTTSPDTAVASSPEKVPESNLMVQTATLVLTVVMVLLQVWIVFDLKSVKLDLENLRQVSSEQCGSNL